MDNPLDAIAAGKPLQPVCMCSVRVTPDFLTELQKYKYFPAWAEELITVIGIDDTAKLIAAWGGVTWRIPVKIGGKSLAGTCRYEKLVSILGPDAGRKIVEHWGGEVLPIPNLMEVIRARNWLIIRSEFDYLVTTGGKTYDDALFELAIKYHLTDRGVQRIIARRDDEIFRFFSE